MTNETTIDKGRPQYRRCPKCLSMAVETSWRPGVGNDPQMREYKCPSCDNEFYTAPALPRRVAHIYGELPMDE